MTFLFFYKCVIILIDGRGVVMYIDLIIILVLIIISFCWFRSFSKTVYAVAMIDIFLRLITYISANIGIPGFHSWVKSIFPGSIPALFARYMNGILLTIFVWIYVALMVVFLFYVTRTFIRKK